MNKKSAFTVIVQLQENMAPEMTNNVINSQHVTPILQEGLNLILKIYGQNIPKENRPISNFLKNIIAPRELSNAKLIYTA